MKKMRYFVLILILVISSLLVACDGENVGYKYKIGDIGPGGGKIFYHAPNGFIMTDTNEKAYFLEAAPVSFTELNWSKIEYPNWISVPGTGTAIGTGRKNTALIIQLEQSMHSFTDYAALVCSNYNNNGKTDWFLPSLYELNELYKNRAILSIPAAGVYWSSSQSGFDSVFSQWFIHGMHTTSQKHFDQPFRAIRAF